MLYQLVKNPLVVAVFSALIGVALSILGTYLYGLWMLSKKRKSGLRILERQLQNQKNQLDYLDNNLGKNYVLGGLDLSSVTNYFNSDITTLPKDEKLISALHMHLDNIEQIRRALDLNSMRAAGFTSVHEEQEAVLDTNVQKATSDFASQVDLCLEELLTLLRPAKQK